ncbi:type II secretion system F family protein [Desulfoscipio gibsoniae]
MLLETLLLASLFLLFYSIKVGEFPEVNTIKGFIINMGLPFTSAAIVFFITTLLFMSPFSGALFAVLGWQLPGWTREHFKNQKLKVYKEHTKNFITSAGGLYGAGLVTSEVIRTLAPRFPEPFASEFQSMIARRDLDPQASIPKMLNEIADRYNLSELRAQAAVIASADNAGGPPAAARGSKRLGRALRLRDELIQQRKEATYEPQIASVIVLCILGAGLVLDATIWRDYFKDGGQMALAFSSLLFVVITLMARRAVKVDDID